MVWGSYGEVVGGGGGTRYNPFRDEFDDITEIGAEGAGNALVVWTGRWVVIWGGHLQADNGARRYDPALDEFRSLSSEGAPVGLFDEMPSDAAAVWTGREMIVWGGYAGGLVEEGARYDPEADQWSPVTPDGAPSLRSTHSAVWTGTEMIVWGGVALDPTLLRDGGRYDPAADEWQDVPPSPDGDRAGFLRGAWIGTRALFWLAHTAGGTIQAALYDPDTDEWTLGTPYATTFWADAWTGELMLVWTGTNLVRYDPATDEWSEATSEGAPSARRVPSLAWTGTELFVWGGATDAGDLNDGALYYP